MSAQRWRPEVDAFADAMEAKLRANDHKRHWRFLDMRTLSRLLTHEIEELRLAVERCDPEEVLREAADVANFCMMTADMVKRNPKKANAEAQARPQGVAWSDWLGLTEKRGKAMACPKCGCKTVYQFDDEDEPQDDRLQRCAACGEVFDLDDHTEEDDADL